MPTLRRRDLVLTLFLAVWPIVSSAADSKAPKLPILAVFNFENKGTPFRRGTLDRFADLVAARLVELGRFRVVPRASVRRRLVVQKRRSYKLCFDKSCQIEIGRELAANKSLSTQLIKIRGRCQLLMTLHDLRTGVAERASTADGLCTEKALHHMVLRGVQEISFGELPSIKGSIDKEKVRAVIESYLDQVKECYRLAVERRPNAAGRVVVRFTIAATGRVAKAGIESTTLNDAATEACLTKAIYHWKFPPPRSGGVVVVSYPFVFKPAE
jgi:TonB family protein